MAWSRSKSSRVATPIDTDTGSNSPLDNSNGMLDAGADALGDHGGAVQVRIDQEHDKLFAAEAPQGIGDAQLRLDAAGDFAQHFVAALVAHAVVDQLEMVDVDVHAGNAVGLAARAADFFQQAAVDVAAVVDTRERIGQPDIFEHLVADDVFQADGDDRRHVLDEIRAQRGRKTGGVDAAQIEAADHPLVAQQGHQGNALQAHRRLGEHGLVQAGDVGTEMGPGRSRQGFAAGRHEAQRQFALDENQFREGGEIHPQFAHHGVDVGVLVEQGERHHVEVRDDGQAAENRADQLRKGGGADDFQIEGLVAAHDRMVAFSLLQQIVQARAQRRVFGLQFGRHDYLLGHGTPVNVVIGGNIHKLSQHYANFSRLETNKVVA